jgi:hypothetical protein
LMCPNYAADAYIHTTFDQCQRAWARGKEI